MVIRRRWAAVGIYAGVIMVGCGDSERVSAPAKFVPPTEAEVERGKKMLGPGMDMLKELAQKKGGARPGSKTPTR
jgi:hypothetical protein